MLHGKQSEERLRKRDEGAVDEKVQIIININSGLFVNLDEERERKNEGSIREGTYYTFSTQFPSLRTCLCPSREFKGEFVISSIPGCHLIN